MPVVARTGDYGKPALIGVPYDIKSSFLRGSVAAPALIRQALNSPSANLWSETGLDLGAPEAYFEGGDLDFGDQANDPAEGATEKVFASIESAISGLIEQGYRPVSLGGDHSISFPLVRAVARHHQRMSLLHFDAHPDTYDRFEGDRYSHACPFARIMEAGLVERMVSVGIRTMTGHQQEQSRRFGIEIVRMQDLHPSMKFAFATPVYLSFDMDVLDPAFAPGVSHWEPGGLSTRQALDMIQALQAPLVGADIVEYNPARDPQNFTAMVAAKILKEILAKMLLD